MSPSGIEPGTPEFYIGWAPTPPRQRHFLRLVVLALAVLVVGVAVTAVLGLRREDHATFEVGAPRTWQGRIALAPGPILWTPEGEAVYLVAPGKHGASALLTGLDGRDVELRGTLIARDGLLGPQRMVEIEPGSPRALAGATPTGGPPEARRLGRVRWRGEIADGKCFLGVMVPGAGKTHRDCAARCLSGGTPPMLALADGRGGEVAVLLASPDGAALGARLAPFAGEPVWASGELVAYARLTVLELDPTGVTRADD